MEDLLHCLHPSEWANLLPLWIAIGTFIWYRRGRLWKFYYTILDETNKQFDQAKIDSIKWEKIATETTEKIVSDYFGILFQFEIDYLRWLIIQNKYEFWDTDESHSSGIETDKNGNRIRVLSGKKIKVDKDYCNYKIGQIYYWKLFMGGLGLFFSSIFWIFFKKKRDSGVEEYNIKYPETE